MKEKMLTNCVSCAIGLLVNFASTVGVTCVTVRCLHNEFVNKIEITFSKLGCCLAITIAIFLLTVSVHYTFLTIEAFTEKNNTLTIITLLTNLFLCLRPSVEIILSVCKSRFMVDHFKGLESIRQNWKEAQKEDLLEIEAVRDFRRRTVHFLIVMVSILLAYATYLMIVDFKANWSVMHKIATIICFCADTTLAIMYSTLPRFYATFFLTYQRNLRNILLKYESMFKSEEYTRSEIETQNRILSRALVLNTRLHCALMWSMKYFNKFCDPSATIWLILTLILLVANSFLLLTIWIDTHFVSFEPRFVGMELQLIFATVTITYSLYNLHELGSVNDNILSNLFQYQISKLSAAEASRVEMLITVLSTQKPILKGSDIFILDIRLLAPISGTVLTYILVAFQFNAFWSQ